MLESLGLIKKLNPENEFDFFRIQMVSFRSFLGLVVGGSISS